MSLNASDVGADTAGTAASAVGTHASAVDPHGDRAHADKYIIMPPLGDDAVEALKAATAIGKCYAIKDANRSLFGVGIGCNGYRAAEFEFMADADGLWRIRYAYTNSIREPSGTVQATNCRDAAGVAYPIGSVTTSGDNKYFTSSQVGYKFDLVFTGIGLIFRHYSDNRGGVWRITIDGTIVTYVSTWSEAAISDNKAVVAAGLINGVHTAVFEFLGSDFASAGLSAPTTTGTGYPRGWFKFDDGVTPTFTTGLVLSGAEMAMQWSGKTLTLTNILEFAVQMTASDTDVLEDWVPAHGDATGAIVIQSRKLYIDGTERLTSLVDWVTGTEFEIKDFEIVQAYTAYSSYDTKRSYPLFDGILTHKFNKDGMQIKNTMKALRNVTIADGFSAMLAGKITAFGELRMDNGYSMGNISTPALNTDYSPGYARSALMFSRSSGNAAAISVGSVFESVSDGRGWKTGQPTLLVIRSDGIQKLYFVQAGPDLNVPAGTTLTSRATIFHAAAWPLRSIA